MDWLHFTTTKPWKTKLLVKQGLIRPLSLWTPFSSPTLLSQLMPQLIVVYRVCMPASTCFGVFRWTACITQSLLVSVWVHRRIQTKYNRQMGIQDVFINTTTLILMPPRVKASKSPASSISLQHLLHERLYLQRTVQLFFVNAFLYAPASRRSTWNWGRRHATRTTRQFSSFLSYWGSHCSVLYCSDSWHAAVEAGGGL